ncbi:MAG: hypothetical protein ACOCUI_05265 [bacterium]
MATNNEPGCLMYIVYAFLFYIVAFYVLSFVSYILPGFIIKAFLIGLVIFIIYGISTEAQK